MPSISASSPLIDVATAEGQLQIARLRERFLNDPSTELPGVRPAIVTSWRRSARSNVDARMGVPPSGNPYIDEQTRRCAEQTLANLVDVAADLRGFLTLVSPKGAVSSSLTPETEERFPVGLTTLEEVWGTNSDGTSIEDGHGVQVWGAENFQEEMQDLYCVSALIRDPFRHSIRAVLGMALPMKVALQSMPGTLRLLVEGEAAKVTQELTTRMTARESVLLARYLDTVRRNSGGVLAFDDRMTIISRSASDLLEKADYAVIQAYVAEVLDSGKSLERTIALTGEREARVRVAPAFDSSSDVHGGVVVSLLPRNEKPFLPGVDVRGSSVMGRPHAVFQDLVGSSAAFARTLAAASVAVGREVPVHVVGELGTGKAALARRVLSVRRPGTRVVDCAQFDEAGPLVAAVAVALKSGEALLLQGADSLTECLGVALAAELRRHPSAPVAVTMRRFTTATEALTEALQSMELSVPPLRSRRDDIPALVRHLLAGRSARASEDVIRVLAEASWPGNIGQLVTVLDDAVAAANGATITPTHLPWGFRRSVARGRLTRIEEAELHELRQALAEAKGNKAKAADILQIGRSTLYRRLESYRRRGLDIEF